MVSVIDVNYQTRCYRFSVDTVSDIELLPRVGVVGGGKLNTISSCCAGSTARQTSTGNLYILNGDQNQWIKVSSNTGGSGGTGSVLPDDLEYATNEDIDNMF